MTAQAVEILVAQFTLAGLNLSLAPAGGLAVAPSSHLTAGLRDLIRNNKALLIDWLTAENAAASHAPEQTSTALDWKELAAAYHAHHFKCPICIAAGRDSRYGQRCGVGITLWRAYDECHASTCNASIATPT